jgi:hypothetical protein
MDTREQKLIEALTRYENGESLSSLQKAFPSVAADLAELVQTVSMVKQQAQAIVPSRQLAQRIIARLGGASASSPFSFLDLSRNLLRFGVPVGIAAIALVLVTSQPANPTPEVGQQDAAPEMMMLRTEAPMMAKNAETDLAASENSAADSVAFSSVGADQGQVDEGGGSVPSRRAWGMGLFAVASVLFILAFKRRQAPIQ